MTVALFYRAYTPPRAGMSLSDEWTQQQKVVFRHCGETALTVELGDTIDLETNARVHQLVRKLRTFPLHGVLSCNPTYCSLFIQFDPWECSFEKLVLHVEDLLKQHTGPGQESTVVEVPVVYGGQWGPDIETVASHNGLTVKDVISLHSTPIYHVFMIGFMPGFPYLGGLVPRLHTPRRATPRLRVLEGSVGIAEQQTGIYSIDSPGGWQIIGRTPLKLFDPRRNPPVLLEAGMSIRFKPMDEDAYANT